jgi:DNA-binding transcriptional regulator YdaS (Cro superfamily)
VDILDKVEYKIRADEIKALIEEGRYADAVTIADTIDWKRVKSVSMLCKISDLYKINRRFQESKDVLLMAYDRHPTGRAIVYSLCELSIKMGELVQAVEYFKEFVRIAPRDTVRYILQYKLYEAQEVSLEERIAVLEEFKKHDYRERWAYELAYLYHRVGLTTECVEECDEMFLWFGDGRYVMKALELKALHTRLSPEQQDRYVRYQQSHGGVLDPSIVAEKDEVGKDETRTIEIKQPTKEILPVTEADVEEYEKKRAEAQAEGEEEELQQTREFVPGQLTFGPNMQITEEIEPAEEFIPEEAASDALYSGETEDAVTEGETEEAALDDGVADEEISDEIPEDIAEDIEEDVQEETPVERDPDEIVYPHISEIKEPTYDVSNFNTINLQEALAEGLREVIWDDTKEESTEEPEEETKVIAEPVHDTEEIFEDIEDEEPEEEKEPEAESQGVREVFYDTEPKMGIEIKYGGMGPILGEEKKEPVYEERPLEDEVPGAVIHPNPTYRMHSHFESMLSQESDGQISMAVEPEPQVEKQITGQISIAEYLSNWEQYKRQQKIKQLEKVKQKVADVTGDMFADFDEKTKIGLQEKIEKAISDAIKKESYEKASGRGNWSVRREDVINAAVDEVIEEEGVQPGEYEPEYEDEEQGYEPVETAVSGQDELQDVDVEEFFGEGDEENPREEDEQDDSRVEEEAEVEEEQVSEDAEEETPAIEEGIPEPVASEEESSAAEETSDKGSDDSDESEEAKAPSDEPAEPVAEPAEPAEPTEPTEPAQPTESEETAQKDNEEEDEDDEAEEEPEKKAPAAAAATDEQQKKAAAPSQKKHIGNRELDERIRTMTPEEKELFGPYIHHKKSRRQIINAIDNLSMDPFSGNAIVTGEEGAGTVNLARGLLKSMQVQDANFSGKVAKITATMLNRKSPVGIFDKLANGALIIQRAADMESDTVSALLKILQEENKGLVIVLEDTKEDMNRFLDRNPSLKPSFNVRVDIEALDDDALVAYACQYALEKGYVIDNLGILALHTRISERQTLDHDVTVAEVKDIVDDAIYYAERRTIRHFFDILLHKRYDDNDMIILRESDFMHD